MIFFSKVVSFHFTLWIESPALKLTPTTYFPSLLCVFKIGQHVSPEERRLDLAVWKWYKTRMTYLMLFWLFHGSFFFSFFRPSGIIKTFFRIRKNLKIMCSTPANEVYIIAQIKLKITRCTCVSAYSSELRKMQISLLLCENELMYSKILRNLKIHISKINYVAWVGSERREILSFAFECDEDLMVFVKRYYRLNHL